MLEPHTNRFSYLNFVIISLKFDIGLFSQICCIFANVQKESVFVYDRSIFDIPEKRDYGKRIMLMPFLMHAQRSLASDVLRLTHGASTYLRYSGIQIEQHR